MKESGLYVHVPYCRHKCEYCDFFSIAINRSVGDDFINAVLIEAAFYKRLYSIDYYRTIYIGGGTPSLLSHHQLKNLIEGLIVLNSGKNPLEVTVEMNPESVTLSKIDVCSDYGVTRLSLGIQSRNQSVLDNVGRITSIKDQDIALNLLSKSWKGHLNLDAIAGLPGQSMEDFVDTVRYISDFGCDHVSLYTLMVEDGTLLANKIDRGVLDVDEDQSDMQWLEGKKILETEGFIQYEVSNFSKENCRSIHNMIYWSQGNYIGIGPGASGTFYDFDGQSVRWTNRQDIEGYIKFWNLYESRLGSVNIAGIPRDTEELDLQTLEFEYLMMGFRTIDGIDSDLYRARYNGVNPWYGSLDRRLRDEKSKWALFEEKGYAKVVEKNGRSIYSLNDKGLSFLNTLLLSL